MGSSIAKSRLVFYVILIALGAAVCAWQAEEHVRFKRTATQALVNRALDITATLGAVMRAQRRNLPAVATFNKARFESTLQDLVQPDGLKSIVILGATGEQVAGAGEPLRIPPEVLLEPGPYWQDGTLTVLNVMDLDPDADRGDGPRLPPAIVVNESQERAIFFRDRFRRPGGGGRGDNRNNPSPGAGDEKQGGAERPPGEVSGRGTTTGQQPGSRPPAMSREDYEALLKKQGVHSFVVSLSTSDTNRAVRSDLLLRALVSVLAMGGAIISMLAWRNVAKNSELQIRLVKAGEMNTHLKEMNFAAAGLAHETRNPLNLIRGFAQMIAMQAKDAPKLKDHASAIIEEADRVTVQLNEFINYSKPREAQMAPVDVKRLVADVARTLVPDLEEKQIQLQTPEAALAIEADEQLLRQALFNVLLNATQAVGHGGRIEVKLSAIGAREAVLEICDDGPGVPAADRASIFKPYVTMRPKGVGLGLAIVSQIAAVHHWEVSCDANEPRGAVFRFRHLKTAPPAA